MVFQEEFRKQWKKAAMKVQTINILTNNSMAKNNKNDFEEDENNFETNQVGFFLKNPASKFVLKILISL